MFMKTVAGEKESERKKGRASIAMSISKWNMLLIRDAINNDRRAKITRIRVGSSVRKVGAGRCDCECPKFYF